MAEKKNVTRVKFFIIDKLVYKLVNFAGGLIPFIRYESIMLDEAQNEQIFLHT